MVKYLNGTRHLHLVFAVPQWYIDVVFGVHGNFELHSGGHLKLSNSVDVITVSSPKQILNTRSSTEAELVATDKFMFKILHTQMFFRRKEKM